MGKNKKTNQKLFFSNYPYTVKERLYRSPKFSNGRQRHRYHKGNRGDNESHYFRRDRANEQLRPSSPVEGSEEYMARKIKHTSAIIMRQLLTPDEPVISSESAIVQSNVNKSFLVTKENALSENLTKQKDTLNKTKKCNNIEFNVKEIEEKIMSHILNLNDGRRKNFINATSTGLDVTIQEMQKQKRLELSRILRNMCNSPYDPKESGELINSIIPDIGVKIEELPLNVIEELRLTLNFDFDEEPVARTEFGLDVDNQDRIVDNSGLDVDTSDTSSYTKSQNCIENSFTTLEVDSIEIKTEGILEGDNEVNRNTLDDSDLQIVDDNSVHSCNTVLIKNEIEDETELESEIIDLEDCGNSSEETVVSPSISSKEQRFRQEVNSNKEVNAANIMSNGENLSLSESDFYNSLQSFSRNYGCDVSHLKEVSHKMNFIDKCIDQLKEFRKSIFNAYCYSFENNQNGGENQITSTLTLTSPVVDNEVPSKLPERISEKQNTLLTSDMHENYCKTIKEEQDNIEHILNFPTLNEKVLVIQRLKEELVIGTDCGNIFCICLATGEIIYTLKITTVTLTSMLFIKGLNGFMYMYIGSFDRVLRVYDYYNRQLLKSFALDDQVSCMDAMWGYIFMGCKAGTLVRYCIEKRKIESTEKNVGLCTMVIKATQEGPRKVLVVGYRGAPIYLRCAMSGLFLRYFSSDAISPTVYSLILENNFLYCGTPQQSILVFSFHNGNLVNKISSENLRGISCMNIYNSHLFAGCYNGNVYVYNLNTQSNVAIMEGPGGGIISMEVLHNQVIVGTLTKQFTSIPIPNSVLS
ncbi:uncharacterized protein LOC115889002 [Sitophilus oryzae]|uniref:Uncharacterized protein LOC115889002 n=1 Tax=Sitophilus oryzae TaxID=7048 RepID=A0A6J2YL95_SITOR|nr:uncharacterized protein LOC115889002 [Sitophilus oryzae]